MRVELTLRTIPEYNSRCGAQTISHVILHVEPRQQIMEASCPLEKKGKPPAGDMPCFGVLRISSDAQVHLVV
jgi:hypothetical protein